MARFAASIDALNGQITGSALLIAGDLNVTVAT